MSITDQADILAQALERDGFVVVPNFLDPTAVGRAREEIDAWYTRDIEDRAKRGSPDGMHTGPAGVTIRTVPTHLMLDAYGKSPTLDALFEKILTHPDSSRLLEKLAGSNLKARGYNIKRMNAVIDPKPTLGPSPIPHEWHIDSPDEICIAIFLDDFSQPNNGTTALMKGTQLFPFCPRWNCLFGPIAPVRTKAGIRPGLSLFMRITLFSRLLARRLRGRETGAYGKPGDFYIFINDIWHGREPNLHGHDYMMLMVGAFPSEAKFPDFVTPPAAETLVKLPERLRAVAGQTLPPNPAGDTILRRMHARRLQSRFPDLFFLAKMERALADIFSNAYLFLRYNIGSRVVSKVRRTFMKDLPNGGA